MLRKAAAADLPKLRNDLRWEFVANPAVTGIASVDVDGYVEADDVELLSRDFLMLAADDDANVVIHAVPEGQNVYPDSKLRLAAELAEQRGAREERRAAELLREVAEELGRAKR